MRQLSARRVCSGMSRAAFACPDCKWYCACEPEKWQEQAPRVHAAAGSSCNMKKGKATRADASCVGCMLLCRDLRDAALDEASRTKSELRQLHQQHEELLLSSREAASRADVSNSQLMGELKLKGFELTRLQVGMHLCSCFVGLVGHSASADIDMATDDSEDGHSTMLGMQGKLMLVCAVCVRLVAGIV